MNIVLFRIDERFIHGQVTQGWKRLEYQQIIVINDCFVENELERRLQLFGVPEGVKADFYKEEEIPEMIRSYATNSKRTMLLVGSPEIAFLVVKNGLKVDKLNLGIMSSNKLRTYKVNNAVSASAEEMEILKQIDKMGIVVEAQGVAADEPISVFG